MFSSELFQVRSCRFLHCLGFNAKSKGVFINILNLPAVAE
jgi:hypothetical protein